MVIDCFICNNVDGLVVPIPILPLPVANKASIPSLPSIWNKFSETAAPDMWSNESVVTVPRPTLPPCFCKINDDEPVTNTLVVLLPMVKF